MMLHTENIFCKLNYGWKEKKIRKKRKTKNAHFKYENLYIEKKPKNLNNQNYRPKKIKPIGSFSVNFTLNSF